MSPIERVRARAAALETLGLGYYATECEIKAAWHRIALECHPDRDRTQMQRFTRAKLARDFLIGPDRSEDDADAGVLPRRVRPAARPRRPAIRRPARVAP